MLTRTFSLAEFLWVFNKICRGYLPDFVLLALVPAITQLSKAKAKSWREYIEKIDQATGEFAFKHLLKR